MKRIGRLWLLAVLALALLCMPQARVGDIRFILVDGENANGQTYQLDRSGTTPYLSVEVDAQGVWAGCSVTWSSDDEKVAIVDGTGKYGVVYPQQGSGSATITARAATGSGLTASRSLKVTVYSSQEEKTVITLRNGSTTLKEGGTLQTICDVSPAGTCALVQQRRNRGDGGPDRPGHRPQGGQGPDHRHRPGRQPRQGQRHPNGVRGTAWIRRIRRTGGSPAGGR